MRLNLRLSIVLSALLAQGCAATKSPPPHLVTREKSIAVFVYLLENTAPREACGAVGIHTPGACLLFDDVTVPRSDEDCHALSRMYPGVSFLPLASTTVLPFLVVLNGRPSHTCSLHIDEVLRSGTCVATVRASKHCQAGVSRWILDLCKTNGCWYVRETKRDL